ncbi:MULTISPECIES: DUF1761 domain-containing protein [Pseudoalteromonas]|uniref:DUF1761 domain-containing protein n=1 Tax=Pseudoalteromonas aurantia 208 TaxID=1314867 RepID=A0ABR9EJ83_9GAMM|nr:MULTISPECIES: DUF1761 domain-containing protein [Pseudoalteromonas]MBE0371033.1 hypothetical protein [Pseudoalteromonas aurantia 208]MBQ4847247.1 DUF1761 domain-containing protein [Pseudoalteromonas sp. MMG005]MBQ4850915.1 DUF1761 domain-containing protein [Pseudoalteromonas sp. MMG012]
MEILELNYWAVLLAALSTFMLGGIWYSSWLFGQMWMEGCGLTELDLKNSDPKLIYGVAMCLSLVVSFSMALLLGKDPTFWSAVVFGLLTGLGFVTAAFGISYIFEQRPLKLLLVNGGFHTVQFILNAVVLSLTG